MGLKERKAELEAKLANHMQRISELPPGPGRVAVKREANILTGQIHNVKCQMILEEERAALEGLNAD